MLTPVKWPIMCRVQDVTTVLYSFIQHMPCDLHCLHVYALNFICLFLYSCNCHNKTRQRLRSLPGKSLKPGFHYPSWRAELTAWVDGCQKNAPELTGSTRADNSGVKNAPQFTGRQLGPWTRAVNSDSGNRALHCATLEGAYTDGQHHLI